MDECCYASAKLNDALNWGINWGTEHEEQAIENDSIATPDDVIFPSSHIHNINHSLWNVNVVKSNHLVPICVER